MSIADIIILIVLVAVVTGIITYLIIRKVRGKGCLSCPHSESCAACSDQKCKSKKKDRKK